MLHLPNLPIATIHPSTPAGTMERIVRDWKHQDWKDMAKWVDAGPHSLSLESRRRACKAQFGSFKLRDARIRSVGIGADPQAEQNNAEIEIHIQSIFKGEPKTLNVNWMMMERPKNHWSLLISGLQP